jgi:hypothetical protein
MLVIVAGISSFGETMTVTVECGLRPAPRES